MPYQIVWESPTSIWTRFSGVVTFAETVEATDALYGDRRSDNVTQAFWDFTDIVDFDVNPDDVQLMAATDKAASCYLSPMRAAFIVRDPRLAELTDQYIAFMRELGSRWENQRFATMDEARRWTASRR